MFAVAAIRIIYLARSRDAMALDEGAWANLDCALVDDGRLGYRERAGPGRHRRRPARPRQHKRQRALLHRLSSSPFTIHHYSLSSSIVIITYRLCAALRVRLLLQVLMHTWRQRPPLLDR